MGESSFDQADGLRNAQNAPAQKNGRVKVITVTGGKGGVGKSSVSLNMAVSMAMLGKRVMVFDADLGLANIDIMLGIRPERNLSHVLSGKCTLDDIVVEGPYGVYILPATSGTQKMTELTPAQHAGLIRAFSSMKTQIDVLIVDTAAGISDMVLSFARAAQDVIVVVCNEPTSLSDAYAVMKILSKQYGVYRFKVVANMVRTLKEGQDLFNQLWKVTDRFLDISMELVSCIPFDPNIRQSIRRQQVVVDAFPTAPSSIAIRALANRALSWPVPYLPGGHMQFFIENFLNGVKKD